MVTAENGFLQFQVLEEQADFLKQPLLAQGYEIITKTLPETLFALRKADNQSRQVIRLGFVAQGGGVDGMLARQGFTTQAVKHHHRAGEACLANLGQGGTGGFPALTLVDTFQYFVVARSE